jgi:superfamily I DNA/RNA helicase
MGFRFQRYGPRYATSRARTCWDQNLCYNSVLSRVVTQLINALTNGSRPRDIEVRTFHGWCLNLLRDLQGVDAPSAGDEDACEQAVFAAYGRLAAEQKATLGELRGHFLMDEIVHVIKHNGLRSREQYREFNRQGRRIPMKQVKRDVVWDVFDEAERRRLAKGVYDWNDLPLMALDATEAMPKPPQYRAVIVDEAQDCTPVMMRLARRLLAESNGPLTVFADPAQAIYEHGFQWTQHELRPAGGNVRWLRNNYRCTREVYDLARPLLEGHPELAEDLGQMQAPERHGPRPVLIMDEDREDLLADVAKRVSTAANERPAQQIAVLAPRKALKR